MTNYTKTTDFAAKDALPSGNSAKIVKGSEIDTEFNNIATASATKANANSAALTGTTTFETISDGTIAITAFVDEDNMASDSATLLPTQQSVKAYVDSQVTAQDLDVTDGSTSIDIDLDSESLGILGGTGIDSTASGTGVTLAIDSTVATLTGSQTLSNKTLSAPVVSGNLTTDGLLDGRDVATDGTKLDGIESGATADQTAAEIKTAYESNADTNAFTDADESKLDGIEASADVTDTANVTAAGALMDSELTSEASVKALNQGVATTDSPSFAGLTTTADVSFGDNDKAVFGAGSDLQIYHDGSNSYIDEVGTGTLRIRGHNQVRLTDTSNNIAAIFKGDAESTLYHNNSAKLATTSTGIDVTGTVTASSASDALVRVSDSTNANQRLDLTHNAGVASIISGNNGAFGTLKLQAYNGTDTIDRFRISSNGDINLGYEDTGTTPKLFWDSSAESLGIGTTAPERTLHVDSSGVQIGALISSTSTIAARLSLMDANTTSSSKVGIGATGDNLGLYAGGSSRATIDSSGNVGIGCTPSRNLDIQGTGDTLVSIVSPASNQAALFFGDTDSDSVGRVAYDNSDNSMRFNTNDSEAMRIDASGNLLVGKTVTGVSNAGFAVVNDEYISSTNTATASGSRVLLLNRQSGTGTSVEFRQANTPVGTITVTASSTAYNTSSDQRLKENIADADDAGSKIDAIQVRKFDWIADGSHQDYGMVAQELQTVAPEAVTGDADSDEMMGVDYSKLVPMLVKEIQSLRARVQQLENN